MIGRAGLFLQPGSIADRQQDEVKPTWPDGQLQHCFLMANHMKNLQRKGFMISNSPPWHKLNGSNEKTL